MRVREAPRVRPRRWARREMAEREGVVGEEGEEGEVGKELEDWGEPFAWVVRGDQGLRWVWLWWWSDSGLGGVLVVGESAIGDFSISGSRP